jgi:arylsulfatase A-like enzyme
MTSIQRVARGVATALALAGCGAAEPPSLLLVTLDTTRADRLGCYGYARETSPNLDRLAADAVLHTRAYSTSSWTLPAHASLFTGLHAPSHGARLDPDGPLVLADAIDGSAALESYRATGLSPAEPTLAELLRERGYATAAVVAGPWLEGVFGLDRGFDLYDDEGIDTIRGRVAEDVTDAALRWLGSRSRGPFFLFLNYYDPHEPYEDPAGYSELFLPPPHPSEPTRELLDARYDGEIRYMDQHFGRLLDALRERGLYDGLWIVVTADHGELLGEHRQIGHGKSLFEEEIRVPLLVKRPAGEGGPGRRDGLVQLTDVFAWILEGLGIDLPPRVRRGGGAVFAEVRPLEVDSRAGDWRAWISGRHKLHWNARGRHLLFDLAADPHERRNLLGREPERARRMLLEMDTFAAALPPAGPRGPERRVDESTRRALRNLGYVE